MMRANFHSTRREATVTYTIDAETTLEAADLTAYLTNSSLR